MSTKTEYDQPWQRAVKVFEQADYTYDDIITHDWLEEALNLPEVTLENVDEVRALKINHTVKFLEYLLTEHKLFTVNIKGEGYRICHPKEQTGLATQNFINRMASIVEKTTRELTYIDKRRLSAAEKKKNTDALANMQTIIGFSRERLTGKPK